MKTLNELFDKPVKITKSMDDIDSIEYQFLIGDNRYSVYMENMAEGWEIGFRNENAVPGDYFKLSNKGNEIKVFATVVHAIKKMISIKKPEVMYFDAKETSRKKLYKAMVRKLAKGYKVETKNVHGEKRFILFKK